MAVVEVTHLTERYGTRVAVDDLSFAVEEGEIFGILGPNGAGKTTAVECIVGLRTPDSGTIRVLGLDPQRDRHRLHELVGVQPQESQLPDRLTVTEALDLYASFYRAHADWEELIAELGLDDSRTTPYARLSGGQKQRLSAALALVGSPRIAVLDELTTGLDPKARRDAGTSSNTSVQAGHDPAGHALHGGGGTALRPPRDRRPRPPRRTRHAGRHRQSGSIPGLNAPAAQFGDQRFVDVWAPSLVVISVAILGLQALPTTMATYRERGILRRLSTAPVHPSNLLVAELLVCLGAALVAVTLLVIVGATAFHILLPRNVLGFATALLLGTAALFALGLVIAAVVPSARAATVVGIVLFLVVMFLGGVYLPRDVMPETLTRIGTYTPPGVQALEDAWMGTGPSAVHLLVMAAIAIVLSAVAVRLFRWE